MSVRHHTSPITSVVVTVAALFIASCGDEADPNAGSTVSTPAVETVDPSEDFDAATEGTMLRWFETAGECQTCGFSITFDASGTARYEGFQEASTISFDPDELRERVRGLDRDPPLVVGTDDCGREVDGNAPVLELTSADGSVTTIDDCFRTIDREHPIMIFVRTHLEEAEAAAVSG